MLKITPAIGHDGRANATPQQRAQQIRRTSCRYCEARELPYVVVDKDVYRWPESRVEFIAQECINAILPDRSVSVQLNETSHECIAIGWRKLQANGLIPCESAQSCRPIVKRAIKIK
jgi:hypothetical protein